MSQTTSSFGDSQMPDFVASQKDYRKIHEVAYYRNPARYKRANPFKNNSSYPVFQAEHGSELNLCNF
ncbi:unnamed protein product [Rotaria magnacalcarata]|uniref:Uncharacterized protein n=1 Tax=Rotaria magnacalcarata TaxID=392030 RepID=A0A8S3EWU3_9BILA|nr:unnamed protein product [Rotaria magnacalcarata]CAF5089694.1 unnamed protein product [Rotaria magnacalcarata]